MSNTNERFTFELRFERYKCRCCTFEREETSRNIIYDKQIKAFSNTYKYLHVYHDLTRTSTFIFNLNEAQHACSSKDILNYSKLLKQNY